MNKNRFCTGLGRMGQIRNGWQSAVNIILQKVQIIQLQDIGTGKIFSTGSGGVEKFAPWVNRIYFVTCGHIPPWLNTSHPKLKLIRHSDYMKPEYLPTFNINSIELNFHRIPELSEQFVYFNDDMFLLKPVKEEDFFKDGLPRDCCIETALVQDDIRNPFASMLMNDAALVNMHYSKREVIKKHWKKWFNPSYGKMALRNLLMLPYRDFSSFSIHICRALF